MALANYLYDATRRLSANEAENAVHKHMDHLTQAVLRVARRDPGVRVLVVLNVQYCHIIRERLRHHDDIEVTSYMNL